MTLALKDTLVATITPFTERLEIDENALRNLIKFFNQVDSMGGIVCNANAGEGATLTRDEKIRIIKIIREELRQGIPLVAGIVALSTKEAIETAMDAKENGCDAILPLAPIIHGWNAANNPEFAVAYHKAIDKACNMPMILFQYAQIMPSAYSHDTLLRMCREIENVVAIKHAQLGSGLFRFSEDLYDVRGLGRPISTLVAHGALLFHAGAMGGVDGSLTGFANVVPVEVTNLWGAINKGAIEKAREIQSRIYPVARVVYGEPYVYLHARYKEGAVMAGFIPGSHVRPPQLPLAPAVRAKLEASMNKAGLLHAFRF